MTGLMDKLEYAANGMIKDKRIGSAIAGIDTVI